MDRNHGCAAPCSGEQLIAAVRAAMADYPDARFEGTGLGQVAVTVDEDRFVGFIDVRLAGTDVDVDGAEFWSNLGATRSGARETGEAR